MKTAKRQKHVAFWRLYWNTARNAVADFLSDDVLTLSGAVTFSTMLSFAPLMLLALWSTSVLGEGAKDALLDQLQSLIGDDARNAAQAVIDSASKRPALGSVAGILGVIVAIIGATTVFAQLQTSLNDIFKIRADQRNALWGWLRHRIFSVGLLAAVAFVMAVSLVVSAGLGLLLKNTGVFWDILNQLITAVVFALLFGGLFRYLPDARLRWRHALAGGVVTAVLFAIGKAVIGLYLAHGSVGGAYGAAGSLVVLLVWVYYSSAIFFFGAELVKGWLTVHGHPPEQPIAGSRRR
jgi:membrane protein